MPLPEGWKGIFYGKETCGDLLFDMSAQEFVDLLLSDPVSAPDPQFLTAGACFDLLINGQEERGLELIGIGKAKWPEYEWGIIEELFKAYQKQMGKLSDSDIKIMNCMVFSTVGHIFEGIWMKVVSIVPEKVT